MSYYIIPIWNWSCYILLHIMIYKLITLFLYGIGAKLSKAKQDDLKDDYIIPIWNWSRSFIKLATSYINDYIIPIWNWSDVFIHSNSLLCLHYIIPIWNWSVSILLVSSPVACKLHYSYMELELSSI